MSGLITRFIREEEGQGATEYMLLISVIVLAVVSAAYTFIGPFREGVEEMSKDVKTILASGLVDGQGQRR